MNSDRTQGLLHWVNEQLVMANSELEGLKNDAGTRRYFRLAHPEYGSLIAVDAVLEIESNHSFIKVGGYLKTLGLNVPNIIAYDLQQGYLLLSDLGTQSYLHVLSDKTMLSLYQQAIDALVTIQSNRAGSEQNFPHFDKAFMFKELDYFNEWFIARYLNLALPQRLTTSLKHCFTRLVSEIEKQPQVIIHRDYHSRNLLVTQKNNPGIIDFQDMMVGPIMYDVVSLLKDCYIDWPQISIEKLLDYYVQRAQDNGLLREVSMNQLQRWFCWVGVQRHLKVLGIFARLNERDNKRDYLQHIPRILMYLKTTVSKYNELEPLHELLIDYLGEAQ